MIEMTLPSRHRILNSIPGGLRPSTLPLGHGGSPQYWLSHMDGEETFFVSFKPPRPGIEPRTLAWKAAVLTTTLVVHLGCNPGYMIFTIKPFRADRICSLSLSHWGLIDWKFVMNPIKNNFIEQRFQFVKMTRHMVNPYNEGTVFLRL